MRKLWNQRGFSLRLAWCSIIFLAASLTAISSCAPKRIVTTPSVSPDGDWALLESLDLSEAQEISCDGLEGCARILLLKSGALYFRARMEIDADGSPNAKKLDPKYGQLTTSLVYSGVEGQGKYVDAEQVPYIVLPMGFYEQFGIGLGDLGAVAYRGKLVYAIFADVGPADKIGEGSIKLAEELGHRPWDSWKSGETLSTHGGISEMEIDYIVFPGTCQDELRRGFVKNEMNRAGQKHLNVIKIRPAFSEEAQPKKLSI